MMEPGTIIRTAYTDQWFRLKKIRIEMVGKKKKTKKKIYEFEPVKNSKLPFAQSEDYVKDSIKRRVFIIEDDLKEE